MDIKTVGGMAIIGTLAAAWGQVKVFLNSVRNLFVVTHQVEIYFNNRITMEWLKDNLKFVNLGSRTYVALRLWNDDRTHIPIAVWNKMLGTHLAFYNKRVPVIISFKQFNDISITYLKGTFPIERMCTELVDACNAQVTAEDDTIGGTGFWLRHIWGDLAKPMLSSRGSSDNVDEEVAPPTNRGQEPQTHGAPEHISGHISNISIRHGVFAPIAGDVASVLRGSDTTPLVDRLARRNRWLKRLYLAPDQTSVIDEIRFWMRSRDWYKQRGIPWRRSMLLYGPPGSGKSSLAYAIAASLDIPIAIYHLDTMTDKNLVDEWGSGGSQAEVRLLEDFDAVFTGRKNNFLNDMNNALSFECLLNVLDGVVTAEGSLAIVTTNHKDMLDDALLRPGRIDTQVEFTPLGIDGMLHIGNTILPHMSTEELKAFFAEKLPEPTTGAEIQETCIKHALKCYWANEVRSADGTG